MLVNPEVDNWKSNKEKYNRHYLEWIKTSWVIELNACYKRKCQVKRDTTKLKYNQKIDRCLDALFKVDAVLNAL